MWTNIFFFAILQIAIFTYFLKDWGGREQCIDEAMEIYKSKYPNYNIMIINERIRHTHELKGLLRIKTQERRFKCCIIYTFRVYVFDAGTFYNYGDAGFQNWKFNGNYFRPSDHPSYVVEFTSKRENLYEDSIAEQG